MTQMTQLRHLSVEIRERDRPGSAMLAIGSRPRRMTIRCGRRPLPSRPRSAGIRIGSASVGKAIKLDKMTERDYLAEVTSRQRFCHGVVARPRPKAAVTAHCQMDSKRAQHGDEMTFAMLLSYAW